MNINKFLESLSKEEKEELFEKLVNQLEDMEEIKKILQKNIAIKLNLPLYVGIDQFLELIPKKGRLYSAIMNYRNNFKPIQYVHEININDFFTMPGVGKHTLRDFIDSCSYGLNGTKFQHLGNELSRTFRNQPIIGYNVKKAVK